MQSAHSLIRSLTVASLSIITLASCAGRASPSGVKPSNASLRILKALERCEYGGLIVSSISKDDIELVLYWGGSLGRKIGKAWSHSSDEVFCVRERDLNTQYGSLDIAFRRHAVGIRVGSGWEYVDMIRIPMKSGSRVWRIEITQSNIAGFTPVSKDDLR